MIFTEICHQTTYLVQRFLKLDLSPPVPLDQSLSFLMEIDFLGYNKSGPEDFTGSRQTFSHTPIVCPKTTNKYIQMSDKADCSNKKKPPVLKLRSLLAF